MLYFILILTLLCIIINTLINHYSRKLEVDEIMKYISDKEVKANVFMFAVCLIILITILPNSLGWFDSNLFMYIWFGLLLLIGFFLKKITKFIMAIDIKKRGVNAINYYKEKYIEEEKNNNNIIINKKSGNKPFGLSKTAAFLAIFLGIYEGLDIGKKK